MEKPVLESLKLQPDTEEETHTTGAECDTRVVCPCLLCDLEFDTTLSNNDLLKHLVTEHKFVIADVNLVSDLKK